MKPLSIYIHFPYCELKCPYCDFNSHVSKDLKQFEMLEAYKKEINHFLEFLNEERDLKSIFFGGGTPSLMMPEIVFKVLEFIKNHKLIKNFHNAEITLEANPSSSEYSKFLEFKNAGINRLSIGVQSLIQSELEFLGRKHTAKEAEMALEMAQNIFENYSFDVIYALPFQNISSFALNFENMIKKYAKNHISAYTLTIEKGTKFFKMHQNKEFILPKNEEEFYFTANEILEKYGFERYEISNYAKQGFECKHNVCYWQGGDYFGIGAGAHGRITKLKERFATYNFAMPEKYLKSFEEKDNALQTFEKLTYSELSKEFAIMNLRYKKGIDINYIKENFDFNMMDFINQKQLKNLEKEGFLNFENNIISLTKKGMNLCSSIIYKLI